MEASSTLTTRIIDAAEARGVWNMPLLRLAAATARVSTVGQHFGYVGGYGPADDRVTTATYSTEEAAEAALLDLFARTF